MVELERHKHSIGQSAYHFVWRPKYNFKVFRHPYPRMVCVEALKTVAKKWKIKIYEMEVMQDHVHVFAEVPPTMTVSFALQILKGGSARIFFKRCRIWRLFFLERGLKLHLWSPGKFFRSVGCVTAEVVHSYIKYSNKWEFEFLKKNQTTLNAY